MTRVRVLLALVAGLVLAAPTADAAAARGELEAGSLTLSQGATLTVAGLDGHWRAGQVPTLDLELEDASVHRLGQSRVDVNGDGPLDTHADGTTIDERASYGHARILLENGAGEQVLALRATGPATADVGGATVRGVSGALLATAVPMSGRCSDAYEGYCLDAFGVHEISGAPTRATLAGEVTLLLYGPTLIVDASGERVTYTSGARATQGAGPVQQTEDAWLVVRGKAAAGSIAGDALRILAPAPTIRTPGVTFADAQGGLRVGLNEYRAAHDDVHALGEMTLALAPVPPAAGIEERAAEEGADTTVYAASLRARVAGDIASIDLEGALAYLDTPAERAGAAAILLALAGGIAYAWNHIAFAAAAAYTRLAKPDILGNDVRSRIYDIIVQNPGISAREVHRRSDQSWGTVVYHLRQLERHHLVVSRALGRTRNYYENHGKYRGMEVQLACLQSERALALARVIANAPGITQEELAQRAGFPQPTTSYYVRKLRQAGLIDEQREGRYAKYVPHADLPRYLALSDDAPQVGGAAATGVQA